MSKGMTMEQLQARIAQMEKKDEAQVAEIARLAAQKAPKLGAIRATPPKEVRDGKRETGIVCITSVNSNPRFPVTVYASQSVRLFNPSTVYVVLQDIQNQHDKWSYRSDEEKASVISENARRVKAYEAFAKSYEGIA